MKLWPHCLLVYAAFAQQAQNPSPMVEHSREHSRVKEETPPGRREKLDLGTLFLPSGMSHKHATVLFFFHGGTWLPEVAGARNDIAIVSVQAGSGSASYARLFEDPGRFLKSLADAEKLAGFPFPHVLVGGWSAGCGAVRQILQDSGAYRRVEGAILIDGVHTDYAEGKPGPIESKLGTANLEIWLRLGRDAIAGKKRVLITHSEIFPGTFASTTETADYLAAELGLKVHPVLKWGPMGTQQISEVSAGRFLMLGFAGNSAPDHVDQLHSLPVFLKGMK